MNGIRFDLEVMAKPLTAFEDTSWARQKQAASQRLVKAVPELLAEIEFQRRQLDDIDDLDTQQTEGSYGWPEDYVVNRAEIRAILQRKRTT